MNEMEPIIDPNSVKVDLDSLTMENLARSADEPTTPPDVSFDQETVAETTARWELLTARLGAEDTYLLQLLGLTAVQVAAVGTLLGHSRERLTQFLLTGLGFPDGEQPDYEPLLFERDLTGAISEVYDACASCLEEDELGRHFAFGSDLTDAHKIPSAALLDELQILAQKLNQP